jgi:hypothetical protein
MSLRCECGGAVELVDGSYSDHGMTETYKCPTCGGHGTYSVSDGMGDRTSGCLTTS